MNLYPFQEQVLEETANKNRVAYYMEMGTGKTFVGSKKLLQLHKRYNLVICQKSKIKDWISHFINVCKVDKDFIYDLTNKKDYEVFTFELANIGFNTFAGGIGFINYELVFRRKDLLKLTDFTLLLDESSMIQNDAAKRTRFILKMNPSNVILLSGTPTSGKYENLYSQCRLLGWNISKQLFFNQYIITENQRLENGIIIKKVIGYKNVDRLKQKLKEHGAIFLTVDDAKLDLPESIDVSINTECTHEYNYFMKNNIVTIDDTDLVGGNSLTKLLYARMLCGQYNKHKLQAFRDLLQSTNDRLLVFYNFTAELYALEDICFELDKPTSIINGETKDLQCYEEFDNSVTFIQYQAGAMGLNLQKANKTIYFSLPLSSELFEQSKARTRRIGQTKPCFYYFLICKKSVEEKILQTLQMRKDYNDKLFEKDFGGVK